MRVIVAAVGRLKQGPERELAERYRKRAADTGRPLGWRDVEIVEVRESQARDVDKRMIEESIALANIVPEGAVSILLDPGGHALDSQSLAGKLREWRENGRNAAIFLIGGADGIAASLRRSAAFHLAFGPATWPHQLVRIMLLEQIYRSATILAGHPYHRG